MRAHGHFTILVEPQMILASLHGSWNKRCTEDYHRAFQRCADQLAPEPWLGIFDARDWQLLTRDCYPIMSLQFEDSLRKGLSHCVFLVSNPGLSSFVHKQIDYQRPSRDQVAFLQTASVEEALSTIAGWGWELSDAFLQQLDHKL